MEINITWNICRVCLTEDQKKIPEADSSKETMLHLFNEDKQLAKQIYECSGIMMKPNDSLPDKICRKCLTMVKYAVNFRKTCRASDTFLQSVLQRTKSASAFLKPKGIAALEDFEDDMSNDESEFKALEKETSTKTENEEEQLVTVKCKGIHLEKPPNKLCKETTALAIISNPDESMDNEDGEELEIVENDLNNTLEIEEEIPEHSEPRESVDKQLLEEQQQENKVSNANVEPNSSIIQDFERHTDLDEETEEINTSDMKQNNEEFYYIIKDMKNENSTQPKVNQQNFNDEDDHRETDDVDDDSVQFIPVEEDQGEEDGAEDQQMLQFETDIDDNQAQVSSTVVTKEDEIEFVGLHEQEENSNLSNATNYLPAEYIVDEYAIDESKSNISSRNSSVFVLNKKMPKYLTSADKKRSVVVYPERKTKVECNKVPAKSSTSTSLVFVCDLCGNHFANRQVLNAHMRVHRQEKKHECELCFKRFITACNLQAHMRIHTGEKPFECQYCGRRFSDRSSNLRHERIHTNEKPFQCNECGKAFSLAATLKKHQKVHTGERLYRCELCAKSFKLQHQLKAHKNSTLHKAVEQFGILEN